MQHGDTKTICETDRAVHAKVKGDEETMEIVLWVR